MNKLKNDELEENRFQHKKIMSLNRFFMKSVVVNSILLLIIYFTSFISLFILVNNSNVDEGLKISLISMIATFIFTTSKSIIDKLIIILKFVISLLGAEQRGLNKNIGIEIDKIDFDELESNNEESSSS